MSSSFPFGLLPSSSMVISENWSESGTRKWFVGAVPSILDTNISMMKNVVGREISYQRKPMSIGSGLIGLPPSAAADVCALSVTADIGEYIQQVESNRGVGYEMRWEMGKRVNRPDDIGKAAMGCV